MTRIGLAVHLYRDDAGAVVRDIVKWASASGASVAAEAGAGPGRFDGVVEGDLAECDVVVSVGGDGTMLRAVRSLAGHPVPLIGVNLGSLGYLADVEPEAIAQALDRWRAGPTAGDWSLEERMLLEAVLVGTDGFREPTGVALNEIVVEKRDAGHTVRLGVEIDGSHFSTYAADGLIVATPTGSTAYSLSARGPVLSPRLRAVLLTPVSPHMLFDRPMVLDAAERVRIRVLGHRGVSVAADGRPVGTLDPGGVVEVGAADAVARLVRFGGARFHEVLRQKFKLNDR